METFLSAEELRTLTGYKSAGWQRRWLKANRWRFDQDRLGRLIVARAYYLKHLGIQAPPAEARTEPNWGAAGVA